MQLFEQKFIELFGPKVIMMQGKRYVSIEDIMQLIADKKITISLGPNTPPDPGERLKASPLASK